MAWTGTENFDSYTGGDSIGGKSGGSGWSANWSLDAGTLTVETAPSGMSGLALKLASGVLSNASRTLTAESTGDAGYEIQTDVVTAATDTHSVTIGNNNVICRLGQTTTGKWECFNSNTSAYENVGTMSANTTHTIIIRYGAVTDEYSVSFDGGAFGANKETNGVLNANGFAVANTTADARNLWVDEIIDAPVVAGIASMRQLIGHGQGTRV